MMKKTLTFSSSIPILGFLATLILFLAVANGQGDNFATQCSTVLQKVMPCLSYVTEKATNPTRECCTSVTGLRSSNPACLCYIILQVHNGTNTAIQSLGVSETRLLSLSTACNVVNATVTECPGLLHLSPNSTEAAIFNNASSTPGITTPVSTPGGASNTRASSHGFWSKPQQVTESVIVATIIFFVAFPFSS